MLREATSANYFVRLSVHMSVVTVSSFSPSEGLVYRIWLIVGREEILQMLSWMPRPGDEKINKNELSHIFKGYLRGQLQVQTK